jgi:hypothetical protein
MGDMQPQLELGPQLHEATKECHAVGPARYGHQDLPVGEELVNLAGKMARQRMPVHQGHFFPV